MSEVITRFGDLRVYQLAFALQQEIFAVSKAFPSEERFSLTDQVRRSSRSIGANIAEAWQKRRYVAHFVSKLTDADGELPETQHWLNTAVECGYMAPEKHAAMLEKSQRVGGMLGKILAHPESFCKTTS